MGQIRDIIPRVDRKADENLIERIERLRNESIIECTDAIQNSRKCWKYVENDPYTDEEKLQADKYAKPLLSYSVIQNKLQLLMGQEQQTRREVKIKTDDEEQYDVADIINRHYSYLRSKEEQPDKLVKMMADGIVGQIAGWVRMGLDMNERGYLDFYWDNLDPFMVHPDPSFKRLDLLDCKWLVLESYLTIDEIKAEFNSYLPDLQWLRVEANLVETDNKSNYSTLERIGERYPVLELQERKRKKFAVYERDGEVSIVEWNDRHKAEQAGMRFMRTLRKEIIHKTIVSSIHNVVLYDQDIEYDTRYFDIFCYTAYDLNLEKMKTPSMFGYLSDVQDQINKEKSQNTEFVKRGLDFIFHVGKNEQEAVDALQSWHGEPKLILPYKNLKNRAQRDEPGGGAIAAIQTILNNFLSNVEMVNEVSGVREPLSGGGTRSGESGVLFEQKKESAQTVVNPFFENLAKVKRNMARYMLDLAKDVYSEHLRVMESDDDHDNFVNAMINIPFEGDILLDIEKLKARAILDEGERSPDHQNKMFNEILSIMHLMTAAGASFEMLPWHYLLEYLPMPKRDLVRDFIIEQMQSLKAQKIESRVDGRLLAEQQAAGASQPKQ